MTPAKPTSRRNHDPAARAILREAARLAHRLRALEAIQRSLPAPTRDELLAMLRRERPVSLEAYRIGRLHWTFSQVEAAVQDLRDIARPETGPWLLALFRKGRLPADETLRYIAGALEQLPPPGRRR